MFPLVTIPAIGTGLGPQLSFGFAAPTSITSTTATAFNGPSAVAVDGTGNLFIADAFNNRIVEQPLVGAQKNVGTGFAYPIGMAVDGAGNLYVTDANFGVSKIPNQSGTLNSTNQTKLNIAGGVKFPTQLSFDKSGNLYIADSMNNRIVKLTPHQRRPGRGQPDVHRVSIDLSGRRGGGWSGQHLSSPIPASRLIQATICSAAL